MCHISLKKLDMHIAICFRLLINTLWLFNKCMLIGKPSYTAGYDGLVLASTLFSLMTYQQHRLHSVAKLLINNNL